MSSTRPQHVRVLIVEDDTANRFLLSEVCSAEGFQAVGVENGAIALERLTGDEPFSLVLVDAAMPEMSGHELIARMRTLPDLAGIPVIMISANVHGVARRKAEALGVVAFIEKPFRLFDLTQQMRLALRRAFPDTDPPRPSVRMRRALVDVLPNLPPPSQLRPALRAAIHELRGTGSMLVCVMVRLDGGAEISALLGRSVADAAVGAMVSRLSGATNLQLARSDDFELCLFGAHPVDGMLDQIVALLPSVRDDVVKALGGREPPATVVVAGIALVGPLPAHGRPPDVEQVLRGARELVIRARLEPSHVIVGVLDVVMSDSGKPQPPPAT